MDSLSTEEFNEYVDDVVHQVTKNKESLRDTLQQYKGEVSSQDFKKISDEVNKKLKALHFEPFDYEDVEDGDYVDFGPRGKLYVTQSDYHKSYFWATNKEKHRFNSDASGWSVYKSDAIKIIQKGEDVDPDDYDQNDEDED